MKCLEESADFSKLQFILEMKLNWLNLLFGRLQLALFYLNLPTFDF